MNRPDVSLAYLVLDVVKCLWLGHDEILEEERHRVRFTLQTLRFADPADRAAVMPALEVAHEQLMTIKSALEATGCHRSARRVGVVSQRLAQRLRSEHDDVVLTFPGSPVRDFHQPAHS
jgi:hypothetical protein